MTVSTVQKRTYNKSHLKAYEEPTHTVIRVTIETKNKVTKLLREIHSGGGSKKVKADRVIEYLLEQISESQLAALRKETQSSTDKFYEAFEKLSKSNPKLTKEEFYERIISGEIKFGRPKRKVKKK